jgi:hypothetical protein
LKKTPLSDNDKLKKHIGHQTTFVARSQTKSHGFFRRTVTKGDRLDGLREVATIDRDSIVGCALQLEKYRDRR